MTDEAGGWTRARVVPGAGHGTLVRSGPVVILLAATDTDLVGQYADLAAGVRVPGGGRDLARGLVELSSAPGAPADAAALVLDAAGLVVLAAGDVRVAADGRELPSGGPAGPAETLLPWPVSWVTAALPGAVAPARRSSYRLDRGVVPAGSCAVLVGAEAPPGASPDLTEALDLADIPVVRPGSGRVELPGEVASLRLEELSYDDLEPLPPVDAPPVLPAPAPAVGPPLGVLVLDDGTVYEVDAPYLLGREPDVDERVHAGPFRSLQVLDDSYQVSRVHARVEVRGRSVVLVDEHSTNGTYVHTPGSADWQELPPGGEVVLGPGTRIRVGHRTIAFSARLR